MAYHLIIAAGGMGSRLSASLQGQKKQFFEIAGKSIVEYVVEKFFAFSPFTTAVLVVPQDENMRSYSSLIERYPQLVTVYGGKQRQDSIAQGLQKLENAIGTVLIHDAVRPFFSKDDIRNVIQKAETYGAAVLATRAKDTIRISDDGLVSNGTIDRAKVWHIQTPQAFDLKILRAAYDQAKKDGVYSTDDAALVERMGKKVALVEGSARNFKITDAFDLEIAAYLLSGKEHTCV